MPRERTALGGARAAALGRATSRETRPGKPLSRSRSHPEQELYTVQISSSTATLSRWSCWSTKSSQHQSSLPQTFVAFAVRLSVNIRDNMGDSVVWWLKLEFHDTDILARILADTSDTRDFLKLFLRQAERQADILATVLARMSVSVSVSASWNASLRHRTGNSVVASSSTGCRAVEQQLWASCSHPWCLCQQAV